MDYYTVGTWFLFFTTLLLVLVAIVAFRVSLNKARRHHDAWLREIDDARAARVKAAREATENFTNIPRHLDDVA